jgi:NADPH2:quinone reductase
VTQRNGAVPISLPGGLGLEAGGRVTALGFGVTDIAIGDPVAYILGPIGGYASGRLYPAERLIRLPKNIGTEAAAPQPRLQASSCCIAFARVN